MVNATFNFVVIEFSDCGGGIGVRSNAEVLAYDNQDMAFISILGGFATREEAEVFAKAERALSHLYQ